VKNAKHAIAENFGDTFRVEDGITKAAYDKYKIFDQKFGHLYTNIPNSRCLLRLDHRLTAPPTECRLISASFGVASFPVPSVRACQFSP
jgi:hypothetical protein